MIESFHADAAVVERRQWMSVLACSPSVSVDEAWQTLGETPSYRILRGPETGLIMVRGRAGGGGQPFNLGEMTVTRCVVRLASGETGFAFVAGRDLIHCERAAALDALLQNPTWKNRIHAEVIAPLDRSLADRRQARAAAVGATKVEFFTLVRGDT